MKLCASVANSSCRVGAVMTVPEEFFHLLLPRSTQIVVGELLAVCLAFSLYPSVLKEQSVIAFVDNISVIHISVNGAGRQIDTGAFTAALLQRRITKLRTDVWWEYVPSQSNLSDGGSRVGTACDMAAEARIPLTEVQFVFSPASFPYVSPQDWEDWWHVKA